MTGVGQNVRLAAKLVGYQITIKSASGQVQSKVTGDEEYEIDTYKGLSEEARETLVQYKLTTVGDLARFKDKWLEMESLAEDQKELLQKKVDAFEAEMAAREAELPKFEDLKPAKTDEDATEAPEADKEATPEVEQETEEKPKEEAKEE